MSDSIGIRQAGSTGVGSCCAFPDIKEGKSLSVKEEASVKVESGAESSDSIKQTKDVNLTQQSERTTGPRAPNKPLPSTPIDHPHLGGDFPRKMLDSALNPKEVNGTKNEEGIKTALKEGGFVDEDGNINFEKFDISKKDIRKNHIKGKCWIDEAGKFQVEVTGYTGDDLAKAFGALKNKVGEVAKPLENPITLDPIVLSKVSEEDMKVLDRGGQIQYRSCEPPPEGAMLKLVLDPGEKGDSDGLTVEKIPGEPNRTNRVKIPLSVVFEGQDFKGKKTDKPLLADWRDRKLFEDAQIKKEYDRFVPFVSRFDKKTSDNTDSVGRMQAENTLWNAVKEYLKWTLTKESITGKEEAESPSQITGKEEAESPSQATIENGIEQSNFEMEMLPAGQQAIAFTNTEPLEFSETEVKPSVSSGNVGDLQKTIASINGTVDEIYELCASIPANFSVGAGQAAKGEEKMKALAAEIQQVSRALTKAFKSFVLPVNYAININEKATADKSEKTGIREVAKQGQPHKGDVRKLLKAARDLADKMKALTEAFKILEGSPSRRIDITAKAPADKSEKTGIREVAKQGQPHKEDVRKLLKAARDLADKMKALEQSLIEEDKTKSKGQTSMVSHLEATKGQNDAINSIDGSSEIEESKNLLDTAILKDTITEPAKRVTEFFDKSSISNNRFIPDILNAMKNYSGTFDEFFAAKNNESFNDTVKNKEAFKAFLINPTEEAFNAIFATNVEQPDPGLHDTNKFTKI